MSKQTTWACWLDRCLFFAGVLLMIHPFVWSKFLFTVDGPAHAYNAPQLPELFRIPEDDRPWEVDPVPVPNWTGRILFAILQLVMKAP